MTARVSGLAALGPTVYLPSVLFGIGEGAVAPVNAIAALDLGASVPVAGLIVAGLGVGRLAGALPGGWLAGRFGEQRAMLVAVAVYLSAIVACATAPSLPVLAVAVVVTGLSTAVFGLARQSYVTEVMPFRLRGRALSTLGGMSRIGSFVGPFLGAAAMSVGGIRASYWLAASTGVLVAVVLVTIRQPMTDAGKPVADRRERSLAVIARENLPVLRTIGIGVLLIQAARASRQAAIPLWADHIGLSPATTSIIFGISGAMETAFFYPAGLALDRLGRRWVAVVSMTLLGLSLVVLPFTTSAATLGAVAGFMGLGNGLGSGINMTVAADASPAIGRPAFLSLFRLFADFGTGVGPILVSAATVATTLGVAIAAAGATAWLAAGLMARWLPRRAGPSAVPPSLVDR